MQSVRYFCSRVVIPSLRISQLLQKPLKPFSDAFPIQSAARLQIPCSSFLIQPQFFDNDSWGHRGNIHLIGEDQNRHILHLVAIDDPVEGIPCILDSFVIGRIKNVDDCI